MTRTSLRKRLDALATQVKPKSRAAERIAALEGLDLEIYRRWKAESEALALKFPDKPEALFEAMLDGTAPKLPRYLEDYIFQIPPVTVNMSLAQVADLYEEVRRNGS